jgi:hypothetical protein
MAHNPARDLVLAQAWRRWHDGETQRSIARDIGMSQQALSEALRNFGARYGLQARHRARVLALALGPGQGRSLNGDSNGSGPGPETAPERSTTLTPDIPDMSRDARQDQGQGVLAARS